ncbi:MAG: hypothetical protein IIB82_17145 [Bacteroidetes bacterium]|nr:hypothetical protein [Bacteroidota bacterium]
MGFVEVTSGPTPKDLVSINDFKKSGKVTHAFDDPYFDELIKVAYFDIEDTIQRPILTQTRKLYLGEFPNGDFIELDSDLSSVSSVEYYPDTWTTGAASTFSSSNYIVITKRFLGIVKLFDTSSWPSIYDREDAVIVTYICGNSAANVPRELKQAIRLKLNQLYKKDDNQQEIDELIGPFIKIAVA